eukprot:maker-scaffold999_size72078-snap-gene-0.10 protein:Tk06778 transcript:maker-scaffold999_size72078-snap-gene-0.10-mRNA-1 annotation:"pr domain zinc finger protein 15"
MGIQGALIELTLSLKLLKSFSTEVDWCLMSAVQLRQLKSNLTQALFHLREKPQPGQLSTPGISDCPITPSSQRKRLKLMAPECYVNEVPIEEAIDIWDQPDLSDSTLSEPLAEPEVSEPGDEHALSERPLFASGDEPALLETAVPKPDDEPALSEPQAHQPQLAGTLVLVSIPISLGRSEPEPNPYLQVSTELKDLLLWLNAQPLCHRPQDPPLPLDFQVLKGRTREHYGLYPSKRALIELTLSLKLLKSFSTEVDWCLMSAVQLRQLKSNLTQALFHLREKPQPGQLSTPGISDCPITPSSQRKRLKLMAPECYVNEVPIEEAIDIWDQPDLSDSTLSEPLAEPEVSEPGDEHALSERPLFASGDEPALLETAVPKPDDEPALSEPQAHQPQLAGTLVLVSIPISLGRSEPEPNPYLQVSTELKDLLLWLNAQPLCHRPQDPPLPLDFQVLKGRTREHYGLYPSKNWRYHLTFLLLKLPYFRHNHSLFFASIFHQSSAHWRLRLLVVRKVVEGKPLSSSDAKNSSKEKDFLLQVQIPVAENLINLGLSSIDLECLKEQEQQANQESQLPLPQSLEENCQDLPEIGSGIVEVEMLKTFGTIQFYAYNRCLLPAMKSEGCIGVMGLVKTGETSLKGRMIVRHWQSPSSNPGEDLSNLTDLISQVFGMPRLATFKRAEMVPEGEGKTYTESWTRGQRHSMASKKKKPQLEAAFEAIIDYGKHATHVDIHELSFGSKHVMELEVVEDLPWTEIKNMALVMRKSLTGRLGLKPLLSQDCLDKFLAQARACPKIEDKRLTHPQFCRSMLEVFKWLVNVESKEMVQRFSVFGQEFRKVRSLWNVVKNVDFAQIPKFKEPNAQSKYFQVKQCEYCGRTITSFTAGDKLSLAGHTRKCKTDKVTCACGIAFSSRRDRHNHMILKHSDGNYLKCDQCVFVTQDQMLLDTHVERYHGFPGREEVCHLCQKSFRCRNHLYQHHLTHESHFCTPCGREFLGRSNFQRHMKTEHGSGFPCTLCGILILTQAHMAKHMKLKHPEQEGLS